MKTIENVLKGLQIMLVVFGIGYMLANFADTAQLLSPADIYNEQIYLSLILNALQVLGLFGGTVALGALLRTFSK